MSSYQPPEWSEAPIHPFKLEMIKNGSLERVVDVDRRTYYVFGRNPQAHIVLDHPSISRFHAVLQYRSHQAFIQDLGSSHGTILNKHHLPKGKFIEIFVGDLLRFGGSSRIYILEGPDECRRKEVISKILLP